MKTSTLGHETRDAVLVAIAQDMIARTSMSQDGFAERLNHRLFEAAPARCEDEKYPNLKALTKTSDMATYGRVFNTWCKRVERWLAGAREGVTIPSWIEESWIAALDHPWRERALIELAGRYGLLAVRPVGVEGMGAMQVFGALLGRMGDVTSVGSKVFDDLMLDESDKEHLPEFTTALYALAAKATALAQASERVSESVA